ncbi:hypothetical protein [Okeania sp.]|nr:hypothetical protein [Okeania sp.]MEB3341626.1 hypothetical protein [Okeania sp.]
MLKTLLNFIPLTEEEMIEKSKLALEDYRRGWVSIDHSPVREWVDYQ